MAQHSRQSHLIRRSALTKDQVWFPLSQIQDCRRKYTICPSKPTSRVLRDVLNINTFVDQAQPGRVEYKFNAIFDLFVVVGGSSLNEKTHRPRVS